MSSLSRIWPGFGYFNNLPADFNMKKKKYPDNSVIYVNQAYLTAKNNKKVFYADYYLIGQIIEVLNSPENIVNYVCKDYEEKTNNPRYDMSAGKFLGLYETIVYIIVHGDEKEHFLN